MNSTSLSSQGRKDTSAQRQVLEEAVEERQEYTGVLRVQRRGKSALAYRGEARVHCRRGQSALEYSGCSVDSNIGRDVDVLSLYVLRLKANTTDSMNPKGCAVPQKLPDYSGLGLWFRSGLGLWFQSVLGLGLDIAVANFTTSTVLSLRIRIRER